MDSGERGGGVDWLVGCCYKEGRKEGVRREGGAQFGDAFCGIDSRECESGDRVLQLW